MTTIFHDEGVTGPGCHVLIIGINEYLYGLSGTANIGLKQLTSPVPSAYAMANWFLGRKGTSPGTIGYHNPQVPLASIEMLVSPAGVFKRNDGTVVNVDAATKANIFAAFKAWRAKLMQAAGATGVFYFCGHGLMVANHYLLASDFGDPESPPWENSFDLNLTIRSLQRDVNGPLYFLIDACRQISERQYETLGSTPQALQMVNLSVADKNCPCTLIEAAGEGELAMGSPNEVARFTSSIIKALSGYAGRKIPGQKSWEVTGDKLAEAARVIIERGNLNTKTPQHVEQTLRGNSVLHVQTDTPQVLVTIDLDPRSRLDQYTLYLQRVGSERIDYSGPDCPWYVAGPVLSGNYEIGALRRTSIEGHIRYSDERLDPPSYDICISVT